MKELWPLEGISLVKQSLTRSVKMQPGLNTAIRVTVTLASVKI